MIFDFEAKPLCAMKKFLLSAAATWYTISTRTPGAKHSPEPYDWAVRFETLAKDPLLVLSRGLRSNPGLELANAFGVNF
jgi:hypothetical protein